MTMLAHQEAKERTGALATGAPLSLAERMGLSQEQLDLIRNTVARGASDLELEFFLSTAKRAGLDPLAKQIYFVKRGGNATIQTGIDGYRSIAERTGQYDGQDEPRFEVDDKGRIMSATVSVYRKGMGRAISATAYWEEYAQSGGLWAKMPRTMLAKCAEALALRKAFPQVMGGVYTSDEMQQAQGERAALEGGSAEAIDASFTETPVASRADEVKAKLARAKAEAQQQRTPANEPEAISHPADATDADSTDADGPTKQQLVDEMQALSERLKLSADEKTTLLTKTIGRSRLVAATYDELYRIVLALGSMREAREEYAARTQEPVESPVDALSVADEESAGTPGSEAPAPAKAPNTAICSQQQRKTIAELRLNLGWDDARYRSFLEGMTYEESSGHMKSSALELTVDEADLIIAAMRHDADVSDGS